MLESAAMSPDRARVSLFVLLSPVVLAGATAATPGTGMAGGVRWKVPAPWVEETGRAMRVATYVEAPEGLVFFKLTGPAATVGAAERSFEALVSSVSRGSPGRN